MKKILLISFLLTAMLPAFAQRGRLEGFTNTIHEGYNAWLFSPSDTVLPTSKPLIVFLHGASLCGNNLDRVRRYGPLDALARGLWIDAFILAPQNPGGAWKPKRINNCVDWALKNYNIDTNRIYVIGMSLGGYGTFDYVADYAHRIAAAMPICGGANPSNYCSLNDLPLWIIHGTADKAVDITQSQNIIKRMQDCDPSLPRLIFTPLQGIDHGFPSRIFYLAKTYQWLFRHTLKNSARLACRDYEITVPELKQVYNNINRGSVQLDVVKHNGSAATGNDAVASKKTTSKGSKPASAKGNGKAIYKVKKGDTLGKIAIQHGTTVSVLCRLNGISKNSILQIGQTIKLK